MAAGGFKRERDGLGFVFKFAYFCAISALLCAFIAFASPYWFKSWSRVHSPLANVGLWHICLSGWVKPHDPELRSYVGCWWIHSTFFDDVWDNIMPPWFRAVQTLVTFTLIIDIAVVFMLSFYICDDFRDKYYEPRKFKAFLLNAILFFGSAILVLIVSFVFAFKAKDPNWMPRPWLSYFSFSFGLYVLSGFFASFGGLALFIKSTDIRKKPKKAGKHMHGDMGPGVELPPHPLAAPPPPSTHGTGSTQKGESFV